MEVGGAKIPPPFPPDFRKVDLVIPLGLPQVHAR